MERFAAWLRRGIVGAIVGVPALVSSVAPASEQCRFMPLGEDAVVDAPQLEPGSSWTYSVGTGESSIELQAIENGVARYRVGDGEVLHERIDAYATPNRLRKGEKRLLEFPLKVGAEWEDHFSEPGAIEGAFGRYRYDYEEIAYNVVTGIGNVDIGLGRVPAFRVERVASWRKSAPSSENMAGQVQEGRRLRHRHRSHRELVRAVGWPRRAAHPGDVRTRAPAAVAGRGRRGFPGARHGDDRVSPAVRLRGSWRPETCAEGGGRAVPRIRAARQ